jgi:NitT/TauT family transport system substrate-binding protein
LKRWPTFLVVFWLLAGCVEAPQPALRVGVNPWVGYDPLVLAGERRLLDPTRVRVVELSSNTESRRALRNGLLDGAALTLDETLRLADAGLDLKIIAVLDVSHGADAVLARPGIHAPADLKGQTIALEQTAVGVLVLDRLLRAGDLSRDDVRLIHVEAAQHGSALASGRTDAVITFEPMKSWLATRGFHVIFDSRAMPGEIVDVLVARADVLEPRLTEWAELLAGWERARRALLADESAADSLAPGVELTPEEYRATLAGLTLTGLKDSVRLLSGPSPELTRVGSEVAETLRRLGLIGRSPDWDALLDARPVTQASTAVEEGP